MPSLSLRTAVLQHKDDDCAAGVTFTRGTRPKAPTPARQRETQTAGAPPPFRRGHRGLDSARGVFSHPIHRDLGLVADELRSANGAAGEGVRDVPVVQPLILRSDLQEGVVARVVAEPAGDVQRARAQRSAGSSCSTARSTRGRRWRYCVFRSKAIADSRPSRSLGGRPFQRESAPIPTGRPKEGPPSIGMGGRLGSEYPSRQPAPRPRGPRAARGGSFRRCWC